MNFVWVVIIGAGLLQMPIVADVLQQVFPNSKISRFVQKSVRPVLVAMVLLLSSTALFYFFTVFLHFAVKGLVLPAAAYTPEETMSWWCHALFASYIWVSMIANYVMAVVVDPGVLHEGWHEGFPPEHTSELGVCKKCDMVRPPATHHCRVCDCCVLYMDHHCPFTGGCIGVNNFVYFFSWICFLAIGVTYACVLSFPLFGSCLFPGLLATEAPKEVCAWAGLTALLFVAPLLTAAGVFFLLTFELFLLVSHQTTISFLARHFGTRTERATERAAERSACGFAEEKEAKSFSFLMLRGQSACRLLLPHLRLNLGTMLLHRAKAKLQST